MIFQMKGVNQFLNVKPNICMFPFQWQLVFQQLESNAREVDEKLKSCCTMPDLSKLHMLS